MKFIEQMPNDELLKKYDWVVTRVLTLGTNDGDYKDKLRMEILKRLNQQYEGEKE